jgi:hypothetical protein
VALVFIDLDRPRSGFVRVSRQPLMDVLSSVDDTGTGGYVPETLPERKVPYDNE